MFKTNEWSDDSVEVIDELLDKYKSHIAVAFLVSMLLAIGRITILTVVFLGL